MKPLFRGVQNEQLYLILLDDACRPVQDLRIAEGVPNRVTVDTRKLLRTVARTNSTCGILAHNHPTGLAHPLRSRPPDDLPHYGSHRPAGLYDLWIISLWQGRMPAQCSYRGSLPEYRPGGGICAGRQPMNALSLTA